MNFFPMLRLFETHTTTEKALVYTVFIALLLALFTPLIFSGKFFFPFIFSKSYYFRILIEIAFVAYIWLLAVEPKWRPALSWITIAVTLYLVVIYLASIFGVNFYRSFWSNAERSEGLLMLTHLWAYFLMLTGILRTKRQWFVFLKTVLFVALLTTLYALDQKWQVFIPRINSFLGSVGSTMRLSLAQAGVDRLTSTIGNAAFFAAYLLLNIVIVAYLFFYHRVMKWRIVYGVIIAFFILVLFYTATRGALLALIGGVLLYSVLLLFLHKNKKMRMAGIGMLIAMLVAIGGVWMAKDTVFVQDIQALQRLTTMSFSDATTVSRLATWKASWIAFTEHPLLGIGYENYRIAFNKHFPITLFDIHAEQWFDRAHNVIFDVLVASGIIGFLSYVSIFIAAFYALWRIYREYPERIYGLLILGVGLLAYLGQNLFVFDTLPTYLLFFVILAYLARSATLTDRERERLTLTRMNTWFRRMRPNNILLAGVVTLFIFWVHVQVNMLPARANAALATAITHQARGNYTEAVDSYRKSAQSTTSQRYEARQRYGEFMLSNNLAQTFSPEETEQLYEESIEFLEESLKSYGDDVQNHLYLLSLYNRGSVYDQEYIDRAEALGETALDLSPSRPHLYFELARTAAGRNTEEGRAKGLAYLEEVLELSPDNPEMYLNLLNAQLSSGMEEEAKRTYDHITTLAAWEGALGERKKLAELYIRYEHFAEAVVLYEELIDMGSEKSEYFIRLAALYRQVGDYARAKSSALRAAEVDPSLAGETQLFIEQLEKEVENES